MAASGADRSALVTAIYNHDYRVIADCLRRCPELVSDTRLPLVCLCLWKVVEAEALPKNLPNLMFTSLLLIGTKAKCPRLSAVLKRWIELY